MEIEVRYNTVPHCRRCRKNSVTEDGRRRVLCLDCGMSLCPGCARQNCGSKKSHKTVDLTKYCEAGHEEIRDLHSTCFHCKKGWHGKHVDATKHCYDCGKSYCNKCAAAHEKTRDSKWHELVCVQKLFADLQKVQQPTAVCCEVERPVASAPTLDEMEDEGVSVMMEAHLHEDYYEKLDINDHQILNDYDLQRCRSASYYNEPSQQPMTSQGVPVPGRSRKDSDISCFSMASSTSSFSSTPGWDSPPPYSVEDRCAYVAQYPSHVMWT